MSEGRYLPLLCLVGVAVPAVPDAGLAERAELVDPLDEAVDPTPLAEVLADPDVQVIVHAGRQDVALLRRAWRTEVRNLFDTQIAAGFAGFGAQTSYGGLLTDVLGLRLPKSASFTRWDVRPLTGEQVAYARDDVVPLLSLADALRQRLAASGRLGWALEECRRLEGASDERDPAQVWQRLPKVGQLSPSARAVARELAAWRERTAASGDRPVGSVLPDASLVEVAKRRPTTVQALERIRGIQPSTLRRRADAILAAVERGLAAEPLVVENGERLDSSPADAPLIALAESLVRARALEAGLAYELVAARSDLAQIVSAVRRERPEPPVRTLQGWRRNLVGAELLDLLAGERALSVGPGGRLLIVARDGHAAS
jgi:ribonuclease D